MVKKTTKRASRTIVHISLFVGSAIGIWSVAAFLSALAQVNWQFSQLLGQYLVAIGVVQEFHTFVDFYTHIKGVEYIIAVMFLGLFPVFYKYLNTATSSTEAT